jgi:hypothetical protein
MTRRNSDPNVQKLHSSFTVNVDLCCDKAALIRSLGKVPCLNLKSGAWPLVYSIKDKPDENVSEIQFDTNTIILRYTFARHSLGVYTKNLVRLLSMLSYLDGLYKIEVKSLYSYIMEALRRHIEENPKPNQIENGELLVKRINMLSEMNAELSLKIIGADRTILQLKEESDMLGLFAREVLVSAMEKVRQGGGNIESVAKVLGVSQAVFEKARRFVDYRVDCNGK